MALDACVYCDCLEKGRVAGLSENGLSVELKPDGCSWLYKQGKPLDFDHDDFIRFACHHKGRALIDYRLGNISLVSILRFELKREARQFPILLEKVVYNGIHCGDWLSVETVKAMQVELDRLSTFQAIGTRAYANYFSALLQDWGLIKGSYISAKESALFLSNFRQQMIELSEASLSIGKPVAFC